MAFPDMQSGEGAFAGSLRQISEMDFFGAIEMGPINDPAVREEVKRITRESGLKVGYGAQPVILSQGLDLNHSDFSVRAEALQKLQTAVDQASDIEAESFVILSGKFPGDEQCAAAYQYLAEALHKLANYSEQRGIRTVLEIFDRSVDKKALVGPAGEAAALAQQVRIDHPDFGLLYDMGHMPLLSETPEGALPILAPYLSEVHLGNCVMTPGHPAYGDKHPQIGYTGGVNGTAELAEFVKTLFNVGYIGRQTNPDNLPWIGFEVRPQAGETSTEILDNIKTTWEEAWHQL